ncbi:hypothetical protein Poly41_56900 [Novipirellula artificiosorum]|uniref:Uncharacterized protein n=1 Tax=Novipirellula artificiosorum TaxID=2528016 RepID=A0A5C6D800_9BACT|nr:hypothetical protein Poly41_56900 [Novipirellula artificiosorum]
MLPISNPTKISVVVAPNATKVAPITNSVAATCSPAYNPAKCVQPCSCREKRSGALQRCNLTRDIPVDGAPRVLPVPGGRPSVGDSFLRDHWTPEPYLQKTSGLGSARFRRMSHIYLPQFARFHAEKKDHSNHRFARLPIANGGERQKRTYGIDGKTPPTHWQTNYRCSPHQSPSMTSRPFRVPSACQMCRSIDSVIDETLPSSLDTFTNPV